MAAKGQLHGSIPGYRPGPLLNVRHRIFLWGVLIVPIAAYGLMRLREQQTLEKEMQLELEGRARWNEEHKIQ